MNRDVRRHSLMQIYGSVESDDSRTPIRHDDWLAYIRNSPDLVRPEPRSGRNPANGDPILLQPPADTVHLIENDSRLATFSWGPVGHNCIIVQYSEAEAETVETRAAKVADVIGGTFRKNA